MKRSAESTRDPEAERRTVMSVLAHASATELKRLWGEAGIPAEAEMLRGPEIGLVTVRGRIGRFRPCTSHRLAVAGGLDFQDVARRTFRPA